MGVSWLLQGCFEGISRVIKGSFRGLPIAFQGRFKVVYFKTKLQGSFKRYFKEVSCILIVL